MDKNAIKKYAVWARNELIARVTQKAEQYEITEQKTTPKDADSIGGRVLTATEKKQRQALIDKINHDGFGQVMEEVAYTWFNRFTALRFMEVNNYLPSHTRVFTNETGEFKPQILADAIQLDLEGLDMNKVFELKDANKTEELYKYLLITQCNALSSVLPRMFQKIEHYTELLLPDYLLREGSVIEQMITSIPEEDWTDQVQIIGWLYQYYNIEPKDVVFASLKKKSVRITKEEIPAATQLFTPDWIVRYLVENSLGRLWLEGHPNDTLKSEWKYYLDEAQQEESVQNKLKELQKEYASLKPEEIRCIDPCMGSGHILCYMFDVLIKIYEDYGYTAREATRIIVEKNLWGLDIDERAAQLAYFAVMMKARQFDRRFFSRGIQPNVFAIDESNDIDSLAVDYCFEGNSELRKDFDGFLRDMKDATEYGSILNVPQHKWGELACLAQSKAQEISLYSGYISEKIVPLIHIGEALAQKYHVSVTNPPYLGVSFCNAIVNKYIKDNYFETKTDMFAVFMVKCADLVKKNGYYAMITQHSWMFLKSFRELRRDITANCIINMAHLGARAFEEIAGEVVQTTAFVIQKNNLRDYKGTYARLVNYGSQNAKEEAFLLKKDLYNISTDRFDYIEDSPIAYWVPQALFEIFHTAKQIEDYGDARVGMQTGENDKFVRLWEEVNYLDLCTDAVSAEVAQASGKKWFPYNKGGEFRKWYGNNDWIVDWYNDGQNIKEDKLYKLSIGKCLPSNSKPKNMQYYFRPSITWSKVSSGSIAFRYKPAGHIFDIAGASIFTTQDMIRYLHGYCNSVVAMFIAFVLSPTINYEAGTVSKFPVVVDKSQKTTIEELVSENIELSKQDYDSFETSWDFGRNPLVSYGVNTIEEAFEIWKNECQSRFDKVKHNEEKLNQLFIDIYGLNGELDSGVDNKDVTIHLADRKRDIKSLISYAVGCMFGRYSLDCLGIAYAGGTFDKSKYETFMPDNDGIIPILDDEYFEDDIVGRFVEFIKSAFGSSTLEENLKYIVDSIGMKEGTSRDAIRAYFMNDFYSDHCSTYSVTGSGKRPIYWLFDSGKKNGFKCLVYMHRYRPDTIARIRTDYIHEQQSRYRTAMLELEQRANGASGTEKVRIENARKHINEQAVELRLYEEQIHHLADQMISIDLDDGVKENYEKFKDVLYKIR